VTLARRVGESAGPFDLVVTSTFPRAFETAIAMGFAVDREEELISRLPVSLDDILPFPLPFAAYHEALEQPPVAKHIRKLARFYEGLAAGLREGGAALVVCHGGIVELSAVACVPHADYRAFGPQMECCEGVRLDWDQGSFRNLRLLRLSTS
jgi:broad specificity phosphatase PhoE